MDPHGDPFLQPDRRIDQLPDSAEGKGRCSLYRLVGVYTQKYVIHCPTCNVNLCVLCNHLFYSGVEIVNMEDSISTIFKRLKSRKVAKFSTFVW